MTCDIICFVRAGSSAVRNSHMLFTSRSSSSRFTSCLCAVVGPYSMSPFYFPEFSPNGTVDRSPLHWYART